MTQTIRLFHSTFFDQNQLEQRHCQSQILLKIFMTDEKAEKCDLSVFIMCAEFSQLFDFVRITENVMLGFGSFRRD